VSIVLSSSFAGLSTVRNISLIQRSISRTSQRPSPSEGLSQPTDGGSTDFVTSGQMRSQIGSLTQQIKNLEDIKKKTDVTESALTSLREKLVDIREVARAAAEPNGATKETGRAFQSRINELTASYNQQLTDAEYGGKKLFNGASVATARLEALPEYSVSHPEDAALSANKINNEISHLDSVTEAARAESKNEYQATVRSLEVASQNMTAADEEVSNPTDAFGRAYRMKAQIQLQTGIATAALGNLNGSEVFKLLNA
jgi:flagellin